ncbi:MAG: chromosome segregation protein SMC, partial [Sulfurifustaceae bacterium]
ACSALDAELVQNAAQVQDARTRREAADHALSARRGEQQSAEARLASLRELKAAAEARHDTGIGEWLRDRGLEQAPRLAGRLQVEHGWETAVERVLGARLAAVCTDHFADATRGLTDIKPAHLTVLDLAAPRAPTPTLPQSGDVQGRTKIAEAQDARERSEGMGGGSTGALLLEKVHSDIDLAPLLAGVRTAATLDEALDGRGALAPGESIVTPDGAWVGRNWLSLEYAAGNERGWLAREREIETLTRECAARREEIERAAADLAALEAEITALDRSRGELTRSLNERNRERAEWRERLGQEQERLTRLETRAAQIRREREELEAQLARNSEEMAAAAQLLQQAESESGAHETRRIELQARRDAVQERLAACRAADAQARERMHQIEIESRTAQTALTSTRASITRLEGQLDTLRSRRDELASLLADNREPEADLKNELNAHLEKRLEIENRLGEARRATGEIDAAMRAQEQARGEQERQVQAARATLEAERVTRQELVVRRDTLADQVREAGADLAQVLSELPADAAEPAWVEQLEHITARIERLGPINLVAIEEFDELSSRKNYLDKQAEDLAQALATLEEAIRKMDRETRTRFKETFDRVNENFQAFFPRLFGGGSAYLELTENDLLEAGVTVMARPPGKRNSTIHLLSGGEKALSAVALIFSIFELNPAPFCLLDEVDAPLDDANVERYGQTLKAMAERTQLIYITHNKISMENADVLLGVTMSEPGVSRLVAVDVEQALQMVAQ